MSHFFRLFLINTIIIWRR